MTRRMIITITTIMIFFLLFTYLSIYSFHQIKIPKTKYSVKHVINWQEDLLNSGLERRDTFDKMTVITPLIIIMMTMRKEMMIITKTTRTMIISTRTMMITIVTSIKRLSNDCRKTRNTKVITPTNDNRSKQRDEPIRIPTN